jgi:hypothetical protein
MVLFGLTGKDAINPILQTQLLRNFKMSICIYYEIYDAVKEGNENETFLVRVLKKKISMNSLMIMILHTNNPGKVKLAHVSQIPLNMNFVLEGKEINSCYCISIQKSEYKNGNFIYCDFIFGL